MSSWGCAERSRLGEGITRECCGCTYPPHQLGLRLELVNSSAFLQLRILDIYVNSHAWCTDLFHCTSRDEVMKIMYPLSSIRRRRRFFASTSRRIISPFVTMQASRTLFLGSSLLRNPFCSIAIPAGSSPSLPSAEYCLQLIA